jgi:hypothetical protein
VEIARIKEILNFPRKSLKHKASLAWYDPIGKHKTAHFVESIGKY